MAYDQQLADALAEIQRLRSELEGRLDHGEAPVQRRATASDCVLVPRSEIEALDRVMDELGDVEEGGFHQITLLRKADGFISRWLAERTPRQGHRDKPTEENRK